MSHWILVGDEVRILSKDELLNVLKDPPVGSLIYVKSSGRKYGFLRALRFASTRTHAAICGEDEGLVIVQRSWLSRLVNLAVKAYSTFKRKEALLEGCRASDWLNRELCEEVEKVRGDPAWRIVVRAL